MRIGGRAVQLAKRVAVCMSLLSVERIPCAHTVIILQTAHNEQLVRARPPLSLSLSPSLERLGSKTQRLSETCVPDYYQRCEDCIRTYSRAKAKRAHRAPPLTGLNHSQALGTGRERRLHQTTLLLRSMYSYMAVDNDPPLTSCSSRYVSHVAGNPARPDHQGHYATMAYGTPV
ncbi:hypothetical protein LX36DRAFT_63322 [Colletotrichum falcatum]|nr:hypothetical protein LX36DRAFT_63322 [Colletotrichum falcatum]